MKSTIVAAFGLILLTAQTGADNPRPPEGSIPELVVSLQPSFGVVPLDEADRVAPYTFSVNAQDREHYYAYGGAQVFVRLGQSRAIDRPSAFGRLRGTVDLREDGLAKYRVELIVDGKTVARTRATVRVVLPK
jgi:hypothetical protein